MSLLRAIPDVASIAGGRVMPAGSRGLARPNVVYQRLSTRRDWTNDGPTRAPRTTVQVGCWADRLEVALAIAAAVRIALDGFNGTVNGLVIDAIFLDDENTAPESKSAGQEEGIKGVLLDFNVHYQE
ncbi:MAG TPA: DUF3168 domain-containing protein [Tepidisphaeraceae bacterium]|nr:DUF3168 domain-containing protein [Tepidisphaeraceae bacterium]